MLNLSQRLILGCALLAGLVLSLLFFAHRNHITVAVTWLFASAAVIVALATIIAVQYPVRILARDARKIAQGNLEHRVEWSSRDSFGEIAVELGRLAMRL